MSQCMCRIFIIFYIWSVGLSVGLHNNYEIVFHHTWMEDGSRTEQTPLTSGADKNQGTDPGSVSFLIPDLTTTCTLFSQHTKSKVTTLKLKEADLNGTFLCQRHSVVLQVDDLQLVSHHGVVVHHAGH